MFWEQNAATNFLCVQLHFLFFVKDIFIHIIVNCKYMYYLQ
ncbi:hypothetical protein AsAng_0018650 [Aureispira anguillae]|uniref:Uncharacterized protein n=1 Tax=Aureispira anguillae TaxID=2864201 RepID=A0A916DQG4_9BACT|nr:hypothetical protein AsAng_0018650 [Aureispira anguillae]